jgi:hypothetical protein
MVDSTTVVALVLALTLVAATLVIRCELNRKRAQRRADALVRELLTPAEFGTLQARGYLDVPSGITPGRVYRIPARQGLVTVIDANKVVTRLCLVPTRTVPEHELILVHKLLLEGAEAEYWRRANRLTGLWWPGPDAAQVELWTGAAPGVLARR